MITLDFVYDSTVHIGEEIEHVATVVVASIEVHHVGHLGFLFLLRRIRLWFKKKERQVRSEIEGTMRGRSENSSPDMIPAFCY